MQHNARITHNLHNTVPIIMTKYIISMHIIITYINTNSTEPKNKHDMLYSNNTIYNIFATILYIIYLL